MLKEPQQQDFVDHLPRALLSFTISQCGRHTGWILTKAISSFSCQRQRDYTSQLILPMGVALWLFLDNGMWAEMLYVTLTWSPKTWRAISSLFPCFLAVWRESSEILVEGSLNHFAESCPRKTQANVCYVKPQRFGDGLIWPSAFPVTTSKSVHLCPNFQILGKQYLALYGISAYLWWPQLGCALAWLLHKNMVSRSPPLGLGS